MSVRNLDKLFKPQSVALIGATPRPGSVGAVVARNLRRAGFAGELMLVNPHHQAIDGLTVHPNIASLPQAPDLAVIATPAETVPCLIGELGKRGTRAAIIITAGFGELGERGRLLQQATLDAARPGLLRIVGPNCVGIMVPPLGLDATFSHLAAEAGDIAFLSPSGALITAMLDWAVPRRIGFSHVVSLGDMADVDFGDMLDYLAADPHTRAILLYVEGFTQGRKFLSAARAASRIKPVLVLKAGRSNAGARAATSHTGALAGADAVYDAAFRRAGILRVETMAQLFDAAETLALTREQVGERLAILTNGGGAGVLATDALVAAGGRLAALSADTMADLNRLLPTTWSHGNPVDIIGDASGKRYSDALTTLIGDPEVDAILVLTCPTALAQPEEAARAVIEVVSAAGSAVLRDRNVITAWLGEHSAKEARQLFAKARIPTYESPDSAVGGFMHRVHHRRNQELLMETPPARSDGLEPDLAAARRAIAIALATGKSWLDPEETVVVLAAYGVPLVAHHPAGDPDQAAAVAATVGFPVALKILSPDITHKSDVGGVALNLGNAERVFREATAMLARLGSSLRHGCDRGYRRHCGKYARCRNGPDSGGRYAALRLHHRVPQPVPQSVGDAHSIERGRLRCSKARRAAVDRRCPRRSRRTRPCPRHMGSTRRLDCQGTQLGCRMERDGDAGDGSFECRVAERCAGARSGQPGGWPTRCDRVRGRRVAGRIAQIVALPRGRHLPRRIRLFLHGVRDRRRTRDQARHARPRGLGARR